MKNHSDFPLDGQKIYYLYKLFHREPIQSARLLDDGNVTMIMIMIMMMMVTVMMTITMTMIIIIINESLLGTWIKGWIVYT